MPISLLYAAALAAALLLLGSLLGRSFGHSLGVVAGNFVLGPNLAFPCPSIRSLCWPAAAWACPAPRWPQPCNLWPKRWALAGPLSAQDSLQQKIVYNHFLTVFCNSLIVTRFYIFSI